MVRALLVGQKTQTRRVVKFIPALGGPDEWCRAAIAQRPAWVHIVGDYRRYCPYGMPGDRLWVRETFAEVPTQSGELGSIYRADDESEWDATIKPGWDFMGKWKPSIFMLRKYCRITLEITNVRVERVACISDSDVKAEGVESWSDYQNLWEKLNGPRGYGWHENPWVWVIEFKRIEASK